MELTLIGMSRFARRRVLPAAAAIPEIERINVVSAHAGADSLTGVARLGTVQESWEEALASSQPGLVYVSTVNSDHTRVVRCALECGHHVVVDKPALPDADTAAELVALARSASLVLAEATCYSFHPVFTVVESVLADLDARVATALAVFTPPVPADDWRYDRSRGGGALADTGPYAASLGRVLWGAEPERLDVIVNDRTADRLETCYSMVAGYPGGRAVVGHFGFTTAYQNLVRLMGKGFTIEIERPFSAPPGLAVDLRIQVADEVRVRTVEPADSMQIFLNAVLRAAREGTPDLQEALLSDARTLARLGRAASSSGSGTGP